MLDSNVSKVLCNSSLFSDLDESAVAEIFSKTRLKEYSKGETIAQEGSGCKSLGIVITGQVAKLSISTSGEYSTIAIIDQGSFFGEDIIYSSKSTYVTTLEATTNCEILFISRDILNESMHQFPQIKDNYLKFLSDKLKSQNKHIDLLSKKTVRAKVSYYLYLLYEKQDSTVFELPASKEIISNYLAMQRPSLSRELTKMEADGIIKVDGKLVNILNISKLENECI